MRLASLVVITAIAGLTACTPTCQDFDTVVTLLQGSQRARDEALAACVRDFNAKAARNAGIVADAADRNAPKVVCTRFIAAMASGRATYDDYLDVKRHKFTPKLVKIFQGR